MTLFSSYVVFELSLFLAVPAVPLLVTIFYNRALVFEALSALSIVIVLLAGWRINRAQDVKNGKI